MKNANKKITFIAIIIISLLMILNTKSYATEENSFQFETNTIDLILNGYKYIVPTGGTGTITWESSDESIVTVENGKVTANKIGTTTVTATRGTETATCTVNVIYAGITIGANQGKNVSTVKLFLGEHETENLTAKVNDYNYTNEITNAAVTWTSSDSNIVKVDSKTGTITAVKAGTATITATAAGVEDTCEVKVYDEIVYTDFSNAKYETTFADTFEILKITGVTPIDNDNVYYYYIITPDSTKPTIPIKTNGAIDIEAIKESSNLNNLSANSEENYMSTSDIAKYAELNKDMYIWILQENYLQDYYYNTSGENIYYNTKLLVEGKKIQRAELPKLNLILQTFSISNYDSTNSEENSQYTYINFNFPSDTENRKFTLKIGKITDTTILNKIKNNDYAGITELLQYAKEHDAVYSETLTTTYEGYFSSKEALFDGRKLLQDDAYYFIYVKFDDENGKYYPIEGVTLAQAWFSTVSNSWDLWAYTSSDFNWDNLTSTYTPTEEDTNNIKDGSESPDPFGQYGNTTFALILIAIIIISLTMFFKYKKYNFKN